MNKKEIQDRLSKVLETYFREYWMNDKDYSLFINFVLIKTGKTMDGLVDDFLIGERNGINVERQFELIEKMFIKQTQLNQ